MLTRTSLFAALSMFLLSGCASVSSLRAVSGSEIPLLSLANEGGLGSTPATDRELQERLVAGSKADVFTSVLNVLADAGFRVTQADASTGFITASGWSEERIAIGLGGLSRNSETPAVSVFVDDGRAEDASFVRAIFARSRSSAANRGSSVETLVREKSRYREFFSNLEREIGYRNLARQQIARGSDIPIGVSQEEEKEDSVADARDVCADTAFCEAPQDEIS